MGEWIGTYIGIGIAIGLAIAFVFYVRDTLRVKDIPIVVLFMVAWPAVLLAVIGEIVVGKER